MNIVTGYRGEAHITSQQDQAKNQGIFGSGSYILDVGQKLHAEAVSANEVRIYDGVLSHQGVVAVVEKNTYDSVTITSGSQGADRCDLIVARYTKEGSTGVESMTFEVIMGTEGETTPPAYNEGDIQAGDSPVDMPIYEVHLSGIQIESLVPVASRIGNVNGSFMMRGVFPPGSLNAATNPGCYTISGVYTYTDLPPGQTYGNLFVFKSSNTSVFLTQLFVNSTSFYYRHYQNDAWSEWKPIQKDNVPTNTYTYKGLTIQAIRWGRTVRVKITGNVSETLSTSNAYVLLCTLPVAYRPKISFLNIGTYSPMRTLQLVVEAAGAVKLGYSYYPNGSGGAVAATIPAGTGIYAEATFEASAIQY